MKKTVSDLGAGAYLLMHGHKVVGRQGRDIIFEVVEHEQSEFEWDEAKSEACFVSRQFDFEFASSARKANRREVARYGNRSNEDRHENAGDGEDWSH